MNTFRKSIVTEILSHIVGEGKLDELTEKMAKVSKEKFFNSLSPIGEQAYKLGFQIIEHEFNNNKGQDDYELNSVLLHDHVLFLLKQGGDAIFDYSSKTYSPSFVNEVLRQDTRSLEEIMIVVKDKYCEAKQVLDSKKENLHEKLQKQLCEVVETLKELTIEDDGKKKFEIVTDGATFNIELADSEECDSEDELIKQLLKKLLKGE